MKQKTINTYRLLHILTSTFDSTFPEGRRAFPPNIVRDPTRVKSMGIANKHDFDGKTLFCCCFRYAYTLLLLVNMYKR